MTLSEYTVKRAEALNKLSIPEIELPVFMKLLWFETVTAANISSRIYTETHSHSFYEIHFVFSGRAVYECLGKETELCENQALFVPPDISHRYIGSDENLVKASVAFSVGTSGIFADTNAQKIVFSQDVTENMNFILEHCDKEDAFVPSLISGRTLEIIYSVLNTLKIKLPKNDEQKSDPRFLVAKEYISENKNRIITCEDVAKECCLSVKQISRIFKSCTGGSLFEYITEVRLKEAKRLLLHGEYRVKEVGYMLGFENECSFTAFFKRHCGTSPGSYRRQRLYEK